MTYMAYCPGFDVPPGAVSSEHGISTVRCWPTRCTAAGAVKRVAMATRDGARPWLLVTTVVYFIQIFLFTSAWWRFVRLRCIKRDGSEVDDSPTDHRVNIKQRSH